MAEASGVSAKTIRYYESIGLLAEPERNELGYRSYDATVLGRLAFIAAAQALGFTLGEIREIIGYRERGEPPCQHVLELMKRQRAAADAQLRALARLRDELDELIAAASALRPEDCPEREVCHLMRPDHRRVPSARPKR